MAASTGVATQIMGYRNLSNDTGIQPIKRLSEAATQTFLQGTPVQMSAGSVQACATITNVATALIAGFSVEGGSNLAVAGVPQTQNITYKPPNQPNAVVTPIGAPPNDGMVGFLQVPDVQTFVGVVGNSNTAANAVLAQSMVGSIFGLTKDAGTGFWYVDNFITTAATGACLEVVGLVDPVGTLNGRVEFKVTKAAQQLLA